MTDGQRENNEPVTSEQRTMSMTQMTPEKADGGQRAFSPGPAAIEERSERTREVATKPTPEWECATTISKWRDTGAKGASG